ncbi:putative uncharacterized protein [Clostridium sp. CAG:75]|nr:putative uncharacterized protein [Clostridium sp. CAG:75]
MGNNSINDELVAANLKRIRKQQKVTQRQLGERTGKSERTIQNYESGKINFNLEMIQTLASALEIDWKELMNNANSLDKSDSPSNKYPLDSLGDIINVLFQIQQTYDLSLHFSVKKPPADSDWLADITIPGKGTAKYDTDFCLFMEEWIQQMKQLYSEKISIDEYQTWQNETIAYYANSKLTPWNERPDIELIDIEKNLYRWKNPKN